MKWFRLRWRGATEGTWSSAREGTKVGLGKSPPNDIHTIYTFCARKGLGTNTSDEERK
jgi:hypothetical protein